MRTKEGFLERLFWFFGWAYDFSKYAAVLLVVGLLTHYFFYSVLVVRGISMEANFNDGDVLVVNKISYQIDTPKRGDVVAMFFPGEASKRFIKRIIALPNELVTIKDSQVFIDGKMLPEIYLTQGILTLPNIERQLTADEYFVLGDNRIASSDSRAWGPVPESYIIGRANNKIFSIGSSLDN